MSTVFSSLTAKQKKVYTAIESFIKEKGIPPTVREIGEMIGEKTPGAVQGILNRLQQKGVIKREVGMARSIQLVTNDSIYAQHIYIPEIKKVSKRNLDNLLNLYNIVKYHPFSPDFLAAQTGCFVIKCPDNSLMDMDIKYEDILIISTDTLVNHGDIVLVVYENNTLMRIYNKSDSPDAVVLTAGSNLLGKEAFGRDEVAVVGKLVGKIRKYN